MANLRLHSLNDVKVVGRLTRDPEVRFTTQGTPVCRMRLAVGRRYKDKVSGEWKDDVSFIPATVWRETAQRCGDRLKKGSPVFVEGRLRSNEWQTKEGQKRSDIEIDIQRIQFLEAFGDAGSQSASANESSSAGFKSQPAVAAGSFSAEGSQSTNEEEVPF